MRPNLGIKLGKERRKDGERQGGWSERKKETAEDTGPRRSLRQRQQADPEGRRKSRPCATENRKRPENILLVQPSGGQ